MNRHLVPEQMDADDVDPRELARALRFIRRINTLLRYNASTVAAVAKMAAAISPSPGEPLSVLDVAAGSGDLLVSLRQASSRWDRPVELLALDRHALTVEHGVAEASCAGVRFVRGDALALPFADASVDLVVSTLFLHHLPEATAVAALAEMRRVARHGVIVADLMRDRRALAWIRLFTLVASPMVKHNARASVSHAFTLDEARTLSREAGMASAHFGTTFGYRFLMTWQR